MEMTKKEEKKSDLEQLLNSLIEKGWKPRGRNVEGQVHTSSINSILFIALDDEGVRGTLLKTIRQLTSKESGLWQFVCENKLLAKGILDLPDVLWKRDSLACMRTDLRKSCYPHDYEYRLIESALCDEDKLEEFLLNSIKLD